MENQQKRRWNLFARVLEVILLAHERDFAWLVSALGVSQELCERLQRSLHVPGSFPVLDRQTLERLELTLPLDHLEYNSLMAALLAMEIERTLRDYLAEEGALLAAERLFPALEEALRQERTTRGPDDDAREDAERDWMWERFQRTIDEAILTLQVSVLASERVRLRNIGNACSQLQAVQSGLNRLDRRSKALPVWQDLSEQARRGIADCTEQLEDLGRE